MTDTALTVDPHPDFGASAQAARRTLALEWANSVIDAPAEFGLTADDYRHVLTVVTGELAHVDRQHRNLTGVHHARQALADSRTRP